MKVGWKVSWTIMYEGGSVDVMVVKSVCSMFWWFSLLIDMK